MDKASEANGLDMFDSDGVYDSGHTQQQFLEETDINTIVARFGLTGELPEDYKAPQYGDFSHITDYQSALEAVRQAQESFMTIPADIRSEFQNDPQRLLEFVSDPNNREAAKTIGLIPTKPPQEPPAPQQAIPVPPPQK